LTIAIGRIFETYELLAKVVAIFKTSLVCAKTVPSSLVVKIVQNSPKAHLTRLGGFVIYCALTATVYPAIKLQLSSSNIKKLLLF